MQVGAYGKNGYYGSAPNQAYGSSAASGRTAAAPAGQGGNAAAAVVTISEAARSAAAEPDFAQIVASAREKLNTLLSEAERTSPLKDGKLALDMSTLSQRELFAITSNDDGLFTSDEREAAEIETRRRFALALSGPLGVSEVTEDYRTLYRAAAAHLDSLSAEQKDQPEWQAARAAIDAALVRLEADPALPPKDIENDPVAAWLADQAKAEEAANPASLAESLRAVLDKQYEAAREKGRVPAFEVGQRNGQHIDLGAFDAETVSVMALNRDGLFSTQEVHAASREIRARASTALSEGYTQAAKSGDPTAFAQNIISLYSSLTPAVREAAGLETRMLDAAVSSYESTAKLMNMMQSGMQGAGGIGSWFSSR